MQVLWAHNSTRFFSVDSLSTSPIATTTAKEEEDESASYSSNVCWAPDRSLFSISSQTSLVIQNPGYYSEGTKIQSKYNRRIILKSGILQDL